MLLRRPLFLPVSLGLMSTTVLSRTFHRRPLLCESASSTLADGFKTYQRDAKVPVVKDGRMNPRAIRQVSAGSFAGLAGGLAVAKFSKTLAFLIGLVVVGVQFMAARGYNIIPTARLQQYVKSIDLCSVAEDNVAFKLSFGTTFMLAAFAKF